MYILLLLSTLLLSGCSLIPANKEENINLNQNTPTIMNTTTPKSAPTNTSTVIDQDSIVALNTRDGQMVIKLYQKETPNTVKTFLNKINSGFYNGLSFHRVIDGFMAQGGDPTGTGTGGGRQKSELNNIPFRRGSLGLARTSESKDISNDSQFFICFTDTGCQHLTGDYVNFGEVVSGLDVLDKIKQGDKIVSFTIKTK
jgi:peptidylprolyl isomerase